VRPGTHRCEFVSLDNRALYGSLSGLENGYLHRRSTVGHGSVAFWFSRRFARYMLKAARKKMNYPPDLFIYERSRERGICSLRHECTVDHGDATSAKRVTQFHDKMLAPC